MACIFNCGHIFHEECLAESIPDISANRVKSGARNQENHALRLKENVSLIYAKHGSGQGFISNRKIDVDSIPHSADDMKFSIGFTNTYISSCPHCAAESNSMQ